LFENYTVGKKLGDGMGRRNNFRKMMKEGKYRAFRNLPVGWTLQILHSTDHTERLVRIGTEALFISVCWYLLNNFIFPQEAILRLLCAFFIVHSISWFFIGNFWVYMLDSFQWVRNPGIESVLDFIAFVRRSFVNSDSSIAVLVYGSMCRRAFHGRSDLDLRIIRKPDLLSGLKAIYIGFFVRIVAAIKKIPVDLQVVDSLEFLNKQMRSDEHPITVYLTPGFKINNAGLDFKHVLDNPALVLREKAGHVSSQSCGEHT